MGAFETKAIILSAVLKYERPFKAAKVYNDTGMNRSLIQYHLGKLIDAGALEKIGMYYSVVDKDILINQVADLSEGPRVKRMEKTTFFPSVDTLNSMAEVIVVLRVLNNPVAYEYKRAVIEDIDLTIKSLKNLRTYINGARINEKKARKIWNDRERREEAWNLLNMFETIQSKEDFVEWEPEDE